MAMSLNFESFFICKHKARFGLSTKLSLILETPVAIDYFFIESLFNRCVYINYIFIPLKRRQEKRKFPTIIFIVITTNLLN